MAAARLFSGSWFFHFIIMLIKNYFLGLFALFSTAVTVMPAAVSLSGNSTSGWELAGDSIRVAVTAGGDVRSLERLGGAGKTAWRVSLPKGGFWSVNMDKENLSINNARLISVSD